MCSWSMSVGVCCLFSVLIKTFRVYRSIIRKSFPEKAHRRVKSQKNVSDYDKILREFEEYGKKDGGVSQSISEEQMNLIIGGVLLAAAAILIVLLLVSKVCLGYTLNTLYCKTCKFFSIISRQYCIGCSLLKPNQVR